MKIIIGEKNKIEYSSTFLKRGLNVIGDIDGIVVLDTFELHPLHRTINNSELSQLSPIEINGAAIFVSLRDEDHFEWASSDFSGICDVFFGTISNKKHIIGDNFFEVLSQFSSLTLDRENTVFFIRQGYFPPGKTFFKEISRLKIGNKLKFNSHFFEENNWNLEENKIDRNYETFKKAFSSVLECIGIEDNDAIFLSGGVDSGLIAALSVLKFSKHPIAITVCLNQTLKCDRMDWVSAKKIADFLGLKHLVINLDLNKNSLTSLNQVIENMPLASNLSFAFLKLSQGAAEKGIKKVWCGQNSDSLYNLGPTKKSLSGSIKRFYLSKEYIRSLADIKDKTRLRFLYRTMGELGRLAFKVRRGLNVRQAKTFRELVNAYENSEGSLSLVSKNSFLTNEDIYSDSLNYSDAKRLFFDRKLQSFITGRDPRTVYAAAEEFKIRAILPYSTNNMILFFRGLEMNFRDVLKPKRFIYRYLKELYGKEKYNKICLLKKREYQAKSESFLTWADWQKTIIQDTKCGRELRQEAEKINLPQDFVKRIKNSCDFANIQHLIGIFWLKNIFKKVKILGIDVKT